MGKKFKIYIIEDSKAKIRSMQEYFDGVNSLLGEVDLGEIETYENSEKIFKEHGYSEVKLEVIETQNADQDFYNYDYTEQDDFLKSIREIVKREEDRVFFLDLALNTMERSDFKDGQEKLDPKNAKMAYSIIESSVFNERVVISTRYDGIDREFENMFDLKEDMKLKVTRFFLPAFVFSEQNTEKNFVTSINEVMEEVCDCEYNIK